MKLTAIFILFLQITYAQQAEGIDRFVAGKKSVQLSTGIKMQYIEIGNPEGRTILLLHGFTDTSRSFQPLIQELLKRDLQVRILAPDLRGHGNSSMPSQSESNGFSIDSFAKDILDFMHKKDITKVDLVGHSMGSIIAQEMALKHPEKISTLTLIGTFVDATKNVAVQDYLIGKLLKDWKQGFISRYGQAWKEKSYHMTPEDLGNDAIQYLRKNWVMEANTPDSYLDLIHYETIKIPFGTWFGALDAIGKFDNSGKLAQLKIPTLIIWGKGDELFPKSPDREMVLAVCEKASKKNGTPIYHKSYGKIHDDGPEMGHNLHWGVPKQLASDILAFIDAGDNPVRLLKKDAMIKVTGNQVYMEWIGDDIDPKIKR